MIRAEVIRDSIAESRLHTQRWTYPSFLHQETLRHRKLYVHDQLALAWEPDFSFSVSSSRAIPFRHLLEEARSDELRAAPVFWGKEQRGMSPGGELSDRVGDFPESRSHAIAAWKTAALSAVKHAEDLAWHGAHKSIVNRVIAPFVHTHCLTTGTEPGWLNFFGLRLDRAADPMLRALAEAAWVGWNESRPGVLVPGQWHLPYVDAEDDLTDESIRRYPGGPDDFEAISDSAEWALATAIKISVARCARLSYASFETGRRSTVSEDVALHDRLLGSLPIHASPAEHQATPAARVFDGIGGEWRWQHETQTGNLGPGWRQYRKMIPGEAVAPLPEAYR